MQDGAILEFLPPVLAALGVLVGVSSLLVSGTSMARQWPGAFQRVAGYAMAALGGLALVSSAVALFILNDVPGGPWDPRDGVLGTSAVLGLSMLLTGSRRARNAPVDRDTEPLRALAADMLSQLGDADPLTGRYGSKHVDLLPLATSRSVRSPSLIAQLRSAPEPVLVLSGPPGSGKSTTLRALTHEVCRKARSERSPQIMAVYVDLAEMPSSPSVPTAPQLRAHVLNSITENDDVMRGKLEASLEGDADRAKWIFMFDSLDEIAVGWPTEKVAERMREFIEEMDRFLRPGDLRFRAIVAMRDSITLPATIPAVGIAPLSRRAQRRIMSFAGLDSVDHEHALDQLRQSAGEVVGRPLAFNLWCESVISTVRDATQIAAPDNLYDVLSGTVGVRLGESSVPTPADAASLRFLADDIAYCMVTEPGLASTPSRMKLVSVLQQRAEHPPQRTEDALRQLEELGLAVAHRPHTFAFTHRSFQDFFASSWLMRNAGAVDLDHVLTDPRWRDPAIMAMQAGSDDFRIAVLERAAGLLADLARPLISDLSNFLTTAPDDPLPVVLNRNRSTTAPNPKLTHILTVVAAVPSTNLALVPDFIREVADRVAVTAFAQGDRTDQRDILTLLRLMSPQVAKWSAERAVYRGGLLLETTALALSRAQRPVHDLSPWSRFRLIAGLAEVPAISRHILHASNSGTSLGTLAALVRDLVLALRVGAALMFAIWIYTGVQSAADAPDLVVLSGLIGTACVALIGLTFIKGERQARWPELTAGSVVLFSAFFLLLAAILELPNSLMQVASGHESLFLQAARTYVMTWPACMLAILLFGSAPSRQDWFLPQWSLVRVLHSLRTVIPPTSWRGLVTLIVRVSIGILVIGYVAAGPVPFMSGETETRTRQAVAAVALAIGIIAVSARWLARQLRGRRGLRRNIAEGTLTNEILLGHLKETGGGQWRMQLLLTSLRQAPPDTLRDSMDVLADLTRALAQVDRMVPADTTTRIPRGVWDVGPPYAHADFRRWLEDFDAAHPGRLTWLATNYSDALARLVTRIGPAAALVPHQRPPRDPRADAAAAP